MCKLDTIINTTVRDFHPSTVIKRGKSMEQIEYMTNILFALAKRLQRPLDKTLESIEKSHLLPILDKAYLCRKQKSSNDISLIAAYCLVKSISTMNSFPCSFPRIIPPMWRIFFLFYIRTWIVFKEYAKTAPNIVLSK